LTLSFTLSQQFNNLPAIRGLFNLSQKRANFLKAKDKYRKNISKNLAGAIIAK